MQIRKLRILRSCLVVLATLVFGLPTDSRATLVDSRTWSGDSCGSAGLPGSGSCFGATYSLVVDDRGDSNASTFSGTLSVAISTYTGTMAYIGAVDFKPGKVVSPVTLTAAPGPLSDWQTLFSNGQAAGNCLNGAGGFLCSYDIGTNTNAPTSNNTTYAWSWNFSLDGSGYTFGHLGVNYTATDDSCRRSLGGGDFARVNDCKNDGENISISAGGNRQIPEPSTLVLVGFGLIAISVISRRNLSRS